MTAPLSVLVTTLNQEANIRRCLESVVGWAGEIWVVDSFSTDRTLEMVGRYPVKMKQRLFDDFASNKNWALDHLPWEYPWVLILDADELVPEPSKREIEQVVCSGASGFSGFYVNRRVYFLGRWLKHCGWYPNWNLRLFLHRSGRYENRKVHEHVVLQGRAGYLKEDLIHDDRRGLEEWIARHNQFSSLEAAERVNLLNRKKKTGFQASLWAGPVERRRFLKEHVYFHCPVRPVLYFFYLYLLRLGFLDGRAGLRFCILQAIQEYQVSLKMKLMKR